MGNRTLFLGGFHVRIDGLHIVEFFEAFHHLVDAFALFGSDVFEVVGNVGELSAEHLESGLFQVFP